jgi:hypothetical protein
VNVTVSPIEGLELVDVAPSTVRVEVIRGADASPLPSSAPSASPVAP